MHGKKGRGWPRAKGRGGEELEKVDVEQGEGNQGQEFEPFDVQQEQAPEPEIRLAALSAFADSGQDVQAVLQARDEIEARLLAEPSEKAFALADEGPAGLGNVVGVG